VRESCALPLKRTPALPTLRNPGFEELAAAEGRCVARWECSAHVDTGAFTFRRVEGGASGAASLCIERVGKEPWALAGALMVAIRAHEESATKGRRVAAAWAEKRRKVRAGEATRLPVSTRTQLAPRPL
jgi:hypothetical protein